MFTNNCRDEVTLIFLKHKYWANDAIIRDKSFTWVAVQAARLENEAILRTFMEVRDRNAKNLQAGSWEAIAEQCDEFFAAAEPAQVG